MLLAVFVAVAFVGQQPTVPVSNPPIIPGEPLYPWPPGVIVSVSPEGQPLLDGRPTSWDSLTVEAAAKLDRQRREWPYPNRRLATVGVDADERAAYGDVFEVYRRLEAAGLQPVYVARDP